MTIAHVAIENLATGRIARTERPTVTVAASTRSSAAWEAKRIAARPFLIAVRDAAWNVEMCRLQVAAITDHLGTPAVRADEAARQQLIETRNRINAVARTHRGLKHDAARSAGQAKVAKGWIVEAEVQGHGDAKDDYRTARQQRVSSIGLRVIEIPGAERIAA